MDEIKPDTSLYTDLPNKLRAFALVAESVKPMQYLDDMGNAWQRMHRTTHGLSAHVSMLAERGFEYRVEPQP